MIHEKIETAKAEAAAEDGQDNRVIGVTLALSAAYATVRYNVFKGVPWADWPHFVGNKIVALASLVLIAIAVARLVSPRPRRIRRLMAVGSGLALIHTLASLALFQPLYFDKWFVGDKLSLAAGVSLMLGAAALAILNWGKGKRGALAQRDAVLPLGAIAFLSGVHAGLPAVASWFDPASWPGHLPPITLISFLAGTAALAVAAHLHGRLPATRAG
jgi:hypothetical protein